MMDEKMMQMLQGMKGQATQVDPKDKEAKMGVLQELLKMVNGLMAPDQQDDNQGMDSDMSEMGHDPATMGTDKVTVAAGNPEDLQHGLGMAKEMVGSHAMSDMHPGMDQEDDSADDEDDEDMY